MPILREGGEVTGHSHTTATLAVTGLLCLAYALRPDEPGALYAAIGSAATLLVNPDLDIENMDRNEHALVKHTFGLGFLWLMLWYPYARVFKHRGISHWPVVGTLTRVLYLGVLLTLALMVTGMQVYIEDVISIGGCVVVGMMISDCVHWGMDR